MNYAARIGELSARTARYSRRGAAAGSMDPQILSRGPAGARHIYFYCRETRDPPRTCLTLDIVLSVCNSLRCGVNSPRADADPSGKGNSEELIRVCLSGTADVLSALRAIGEDSEI